MRQNFNHKVKYPHNQLGVYDPIDPGTIPPEEIPTGTGGGTGEPPPVDQPPAEQQSKTWLLIGAVVIAFFLLSQKNR